MTDREAEWSAWLRAGMAGDEEPYRRFLRELVPFLRGLARSGLSRAGRSTAEAEDIVQEALIAIHTRRGSWMPDQPVIPWVRAILRHKLIDSLRRSGRKGAVDIDALSEVLAAPDTEPAIPTRDIVRLAEDLPDGQRAVIRAMFVDGHSTAETAAALSMSEGAVRVARHRALSALARRLRGRI